MLVIGPHRLAAALAVVCAIVPALASAGPGGAWLSARVEAQPIENDGSESAELSVLLLERPESDLPVSIRLHSETVELPENRLGWADVVDDKAGQPRFRTALPWPATPGEHHVEAEVSYVVCGPRWCREKRGRASWTWTVEGEGSPSDEATTGPESRSR